MTSLYLQKSTSVVTGKSGVAGPLSMPPPMTPLLQPLTPTYGTHSNNTSSGIWNSIEAMGSSSLLGGGVDGEFAIAAVYNKGLGFYVCSQDLLSG